MKNEKEQDIYITIEIGSQKGKKRLLAADCISVDGEAAALIDNCETKNEQVYVIAALRDFADAMECELNLPDNPRKHLMELGIH